MKSPVEPAGLDFLSRNVSGDERRRIKSLARILAEVQRRAGSGAEIGGTPFTVLKLANNPIGRLVDLGRIGAEELRAASEIAVAFYTITGALQIKPVNLDRVDVYQEFEQERPTASDDMVAFVKALAARAR